MTITKQELDKLQSNAEVRYGFYNRIYYISHNLVDRLKDWNEIIRW